MAHEPLSALDEATMVRVRLALQELMRCRPADWSRLLTKAVGEECSYRIGSMYLLADAAAQAAVDAHCHQQTMIPEDRSRDGEP